MRKYALITGASGGIGSACARVLADKGWNLYLQYNQNKQQIMELMSGLESHQIEMIPIQADLSTMDGVNHLIRSIFQIDAIVYACGNAPYGLFTDMEERMIDDLLQLHVKSPLMICKSLLPRLIRNPTSQIVIISSIWGQTGAACEVMYSTVKGAQISFIKAISKEMAKTGLTANCVAPGPVKTNMLSRFTDEELEQLAMEIPVGRFALPEEIAHAVSYLLSEHSSYITGQVLAVNGGWYT